MLKGGFYFSSHMDKAGQDRIFTRNPQTGDDYYGEQFRRMRDVLWTRVGLFLRTYDVIDPTSLDVLIVCDLPQTRAELDKLLSEVPDKCLKLLIIMESPIGKYEMFHDDNLAGFDHVLSYAPHLSTRNTIQASGIPSLPDPEDLCTEESRHEPHFEDRRLVVVLNANKYKDLRMPSAWPTRTKKNGYKVKPTSWAQLWRQGFGHRRAFVRAAERSAPRQVDTYGGRWEGGPHAWWHRILPPPQYPSARGKWWGRRVDLFRQYRFVLAFENYLGKDGYISEKLFYPLMAGCVPIYLGDAKIKRCVPEQAFVDASAFRSYRQLIAYLQGVAASEWYQMREAGRDFITSSRGDYFRASQLGNRIGELIREYIPRL